MEAAVDSLAFKAHEKELELVCRLKPDVPTLLVGDPTRLHQIVLNLGGNAVKFTETGQVVILCEVESKNKKSVQLHFAVSDTGIGIPGENLEVIFDSFHQVDGSTTRRYGGTGLGLAISKRLSEMLGGKIWVESELGKGSTFHFTAGFRLQTERKRAKSEFKQFKLADLQGLRILIVDDNDINRMILQEMVSSWGLSPEEVPDGEAVRDNNPYRLVLLDMRMPGMDGLEVSQQIRKNLLFNEVRIIMLASIGQRRNATFCRKFGISSYLLKPIKQSELFEAIIHILGYEMTNTQRDRERPSVRHLIEEDKQRKGRMVLLAEDDFINRKVAVGILEKQGHSVRTANNGQEVLDLHKQHAFDVILMDVQMPIMDGLQATKLIRQREEVSGNHLPIIAMTAYAMKGDRERCLKAGMDGYLSKPIKIEELKKQIEKFAPLMPSAAAQKEPASINIETLSNEVFDGRGALNNLGGNKELLKEITGLFLEKTPFLIQELKEALSCRDVNLIEQQAHTLKGRALNIGASKIADEAFRIQLVARRNDTAKYSLALRRIEKEFKNLEMVLSGFNWEKI